MAKIGRTCKEYMIKELTAKLKDNPSVFITECTGLSVSDLRRLKAGLKPSKASYLVIKNSLGKMALKNVKCDSLIPLVDGTTGLVLGAIDPVAASKALLTFSKASGKLKIKGGLLEGKLLAEADIKTLSQLPSREVLLAHAFSGMKAPITGFVNVLHGTIRKFVYAVNAIHNKKKEGGTD